MKILKRMLAAMMVLALTVTVGGMTQVNAQEVAEGTPPVPTPVSAPILSVPENKVLTYTYQKAQDFVVNVKNPGSVALKNVVIRPELQNIGDMWPFQTDYQFYSETIETIEPDKTESVKFNFKERDNAPTARFTIQFVCTVDGQDSTKASFYVNTVAKPEEEKKNEGGSTPTPQPAGGQSGASNSMDDQAAAGGISNGDVGYSGGGSSGGSSGEGGSASVPRVIVTGFRTEPELVRAGSDFRLIIQLKNTSKSTKVSNMLFDLQAPTEGADAQAVAPAFLPASGSSSIYLEGIPANGAADIAIQLNAKGDLLQKPYSVDMSMKYEDGNAAQIEGASSLSIPVKQDARFEFSEFELSPESIAVGEEANVMCNLYNLGRIKLYNVKATFEGKGIKKEEVFVGNVESGASASIDGMLKGEKASGGPSKITMTVSYEDEAGKASSTTKDLQLEVVAESKDDSMSSAMMMEPEQKSLPIIPLMIGALIILAILAIVIVLKKKKKKMRANEEEELLDELDRSASDERQ